MCGSFAVAFPTACPKSRSTKVCYLHLDMNITAPEIAALEFFDKLVPGGVILSDDYNWAVHIGQKKALDAFAARAGTMVIPLPTTQGIMIKAS
jgi:O-methyltransferase